MLPALLVCPPPVKVAWVPPVPEKSDMRWGEVSVILSVMGVNLPELEAAVFTAAQTRVGTQAVSSLSMTGRGPGFLLQVFLENLQADLPQGRLKLDRCGVSPERVVPQTGS